MLLGHIRPLVNVWPSAETGAHMIAPLPGVWPQKPGSASLPFFGVDPVLLNEQVPVCLSI